MVDKLSNDLRVLGDGEGLILEDVLTICRKLGELALIVGTLSYDRQLRTLGNSVEIELLLDGDRAV